MGQQDIDYPGEDINGEPIKVSTWQECAAECRKEPQCSVFTFNDHHEHCWLKTSAAWANRKNTARASQEDVTVTLHVNLVGILNVKDRSTENRGIVRSMMEQTFTASC